MWPRLQASFASKHITLVQNRFSALSKFAYMIKSLAIVITSHAVSLSIASGFEAKLKMIFSDNARNWLVSEHRNTTHFMPHPSSSYTSCATWALIVVVTICKHFNIPMNSSTVSFASGILKSCESFQR
uniref:(northern house mosquito) hypothetical protein n=1 Tax=Culex pipiens TaxID=7175 RepID=A0A8D8A664_CULPI